MRRFPAIGVLSALLFLATAFSAFAQETAYSDAAYWKVLERGKRLFREGSYGDALIMFQDAARNRKDHFARLEQALIEALSFPDARRLGDALDRAEALFIERNFLNASAALRELYSFVPKGTLQNSSKKAIEQLRRLGSYPEADFWIGETFRMEGEFGIALNQYKKAYEERALLEVGDEVRDILYRMAELYAERQEYNDMEARLLEIVAADPLWSDRSKNFIRESLDRSFTNEGVDKVLSLYRMDSPGTARAHRMLGFHYYATGRHDRAASHLTFAFVLQTTAVIDELKRVDMDWKFRGFRPLLDAVQKRESLAGYLTETEYFKTCYYLAASLYALGKQKPAFELWRILSSRPEAGEWRIRSSRQLASPSIERAVEAP